MPPTPAKSRKRKTPVVPDDRPGLALKLGWREGACRPWWASLAVIVHGAKLISKRIPDQPRAATIQFQ